MRWERALILGPMLAACEVGCSSPPVAVPPTSSAAPAQSTTPPAKTDARSRLQGTWELVTFLSAAPTPDDAAPVFTLLHGAVRLRFDGDSVTTFIPGKAEEESCSFEIIDEAGDAFTLITGVGMFRRAQAHFVSNDLWEATERRPTWPGTTRFQRVKK